jgi:hypothetical protein
MFEVPHIRQHHGTRREMNGVRDFHDSAVLVRKDDTRFPRDDMGFERSWAVWYCAYAVWYKSAGISVS